MKCPTCNEKPFFYKDAPETQAYCPECGSSHIDLTDPPASPEPAQAEVGAEFKPTAREAHWAMVSADHSLKGRMFPTSRAIRGAVEEATATLRAELAEAKRHLADARFAHSVERIQFDKANAELSKAKEDNEQMRKALIVIATLSQMTGLSFESQSFRATEIARSAIAASKGNK